MIYWVGFFGGFFAVLCPIFCGCQWSFLYFFPLSLAVHNLSVLFSNCTLKVEAGRENIFNAFTECVVETLSILQWSKWKGSTCLSLGSVSANPSILYTAPPAAFWGYELLPGELMIYLCCSPLTSCLCVSRYKIKK